MARKKTDAEFKKEVLDLVGSEYVFLDSYINAKTKLRVKHNKCGNVYEVKPNNFLSGKRCPYCAQLELKYNHAKTDAQFKQEVYDLVGNDYTFLDTYAGNKTKLRVKHNKCGNTYGVTPNSFLRGHCCPYCHLEARRKTSEDFKKEVFDLVGSEYVFLDSYVNTRTKLRVKHNKCGNVYEVRPNNFLHGNRCPYCSRRKADSQFKQDVFSLVNNDYTFLDTYVNNHTKLRVKHSKCGNIYEVRPTDFLDHHARCPYCNMPKTEKIIAKILDTLGIKYEIQKTFDDLRDTQPLSYDFYIPDQNILIEYQGLQHYQSINLYGGDDKFKLQQKHDQMKADYAKTHHYNLITVPYTEDTFSKIKRCLLQHGLSK